MARAVAPMSRAEPVERIGGVLPHVRLDEQIAWYDRRAGDAKRWYLRLKVLQIVIAATIPVAAAASAPNVIAAALGSIIVVLEGFQQLGKFHDTWITYRSACEGLQRERYLFDAAAGPYLKCPDPECLLAERVDRVMSREHSTWTTAQLDTSHDDESQEKAS